jgi:cation diffusion facilitator CzcD-associated flavoprotein CzcO
MIALFADQGTNHEANALVSEFVRSKIRDRVDDPEVAEGLVPTYPIGVRRVAVDTGYYESFNRDNVTLVDVKADPIKCITPTGIQTQSDHYDLDVIIFAIGFVAFFGPLDQANVRNEFGKAPRDGWTRGPQTYLGLMTSGFPNLFLITGPGATGVLANVNATNVQQLDFVADMIRYMKRSGYVRVEADEDAQRVWTDHVNEVSDAMIRRQVDNYMVHVNHDDNTRIFMPYAGGFDRYVKHCDDVAVANWRGFNFS